MSISVYFDVILIQFISLMRFKMTNFKLVCTLFLLLVSATTFQIETEAESDVFMPILGDGRNNISQLDYSFILDSIKSAESTYNATEYKNIAHSVAIVSKNPDTAVRWNVFVFEGRIRQVGISLASTFWNSYVWLINYGKYNLTYILMATNNWFCYKLDEWEGDSTTTSASHFGSDISLSDQQVIVTAIDDAFAAAGSDIMANAIKIRQLLIKNKLLGNWSIIIVDPSARFGYYNCMKSGNSWFAFHAYKDYKWNYFGTVRNN